MTNTPAFKTQGLVIFNPAKLTVWETAEKSEGNSMWGRLQQAPGDNDAFDGQTGLTKTLRKVNTREFLSEGWINIDRVASNQVAVIFSGIFGES